MDLAVCCKSHRKGILNHPVCSVPEGNPAYRCRPGRYGYLVLLRKQWSRHRIFLFWSQALHGLPDRSRFHTVYSILFCLPFCCFCKLWCFVFPRLFISIRRTDDILSLKQSPISCGPIGSPFASLPHRNAHARKSCQINRKSYKYHRDTFSADHLKNLRSSVRYSEPPVPKITSYFSNALSNAF